MALELFEFLEQFMSDSFLIKKNKQFDKTGSKSNFFYFAGKSKNQIRFSKLKVDHVFRDLHTFAVRVEFAFLLTMEMHRT